MACGLLRAVVLSFERKVCAAVEALERWQAGDIERVALAARLCEEIAARAPQELSSLAKLPRREGVSLWLRLTSLGDAAPGTLLDLTLASSANATPCDDRVRDAVHRVQRAALTMRRLTIEKARKARESSSGSRRRPSTPGRAAS